jgi:hypothetical protein
VLVRKLRSLLAQAQQEVPLCQCVALVDLGSGLLFGMTENEHSEHLREYMAAAAANIFHHSPVRHLDDAMHSGGPNQLRAVIAVSERLVHVTVRSGVHPDRALVFVCLNNDDVHPLIEQCRIIAAHFDDLF